jgi:hypothetical protein
MSSTAIIWTVTVMGALWAPICHWSVITNIEEHHKKGKCQRNQGDENNDYIN